MGSKLQLRKSSPCFFYLVLSLEGAKSHEVFGLALVLLCCLLQVKCITFMDVLLIPAAGFLMSSAALDCSLFTLIIILKPRCYTDRLMCLFLSSSWNIPGS